MSPLIKEPKSSYRKAEQQFLTGVGGDLGPLRNIVCLGTFLIVTTKGEDPPGIYWAEARDAAEQGTGHRAAPQ